VAGIFDGLASVLSGTFGETVTLYPGGGGPVEVQGIYRTRPVEITDTDGQSVLVIGPTLQLHKPDAAGLSFGDLVEIGPEGSEPRYRVVNKSPPQSPAADALILIELEDYTA
jgi:hypothetical protein